MRTPLHASKARLSEGLIHADPSNRGNAPEFARQIDDDDFGLRTGATIRSGSELPDDDEFEDLGPRKWWQRSSLLLLLLVVLPTLIVAAFEYGVAADQYVSESHFIVRGQQPNTGSSGLGQLLGLNPMPAPADAHSVGDYLLSHDAIAALQPGIDLTVIFRRPEADPVTRLWSDSPPDETLLKYYRGKVQATFSSETGITTLTVRAFRPDDAKALADALLRLGEGRVNELNNRMLENGLVAAQRQVDEAESLVGDIEGRMTSFRQASRDADPERTSAAQIQMATALQQQAAQARAQFDAMAAVLPPSAPQYAASARKVAALERQVAAVRVRLAGSEQSVAAGLGEYEKLQMRQQFAQSSYQAAREQLLKQQLFIVPVVKPNMPEKALYPKRLMIVATIFFGLILAYALGWLILAGVREHAS